MKEYIKEVVAPAIFTVLCISVGGALIVGLFMPDAKIESPRKRCEKVGGMYFSGGAFSADNCVFPPK